MSAPAYTHIAVHDLYKTACRDGAVCVRVLEIFIRTTPATMQWLEQALHDGDRAQWRCASHKLKGNALLIGAHMLGKLAAGLEQASEHSAPGAALLAAAALRDEYAHVMREAADCASQGSAVFGPPGA
jgi:HPt (histidine-containing phosphotransfer) domain-containing protein